MSSFELIRDLHKDARGFRPSTSFMTAFEERGRIAQRVIWDSLCDELAEREADERARAVEAQCEFETRIEGMVTDYGISRATALSWDIESFEVDIASALQYHGSAVQEIEHYLYNQGLDFKVFPMYVAEITDALALTQHAQEA